MSTETIKAGQWVFTEGYTEGGTPGYYIYKLLSGKVSIYEGGQKIINSLEIKEGMKPKFLGILAALSEDRMHRASVKTETDVKVERFYMDQIRWLLRHDVPQNMRKDIETVINTIVIGDKIKSLKREMSEVPLIELQIPDGISSEANEVLLGLKELYEVILNDSEIRG